MLKDEMRGRDWLVMALVGGLGVFAILTVVPGHAALGHWFKATPASDFISAASAIFTAAAVFVALRASTATSRAAQLAANTRANLFASRLSARLSFVAERLRFHDAASAFRDETVGDLAADVRSYRECQKLAARNLFNPTDEALAALVPLPNNCAHRIGRAYDVLELFRSEVAEVSAQEFSVLRRDSRSNFLGRIGGYIRDASELLSVAAEECVKAADVGAPHPTPEELYGPDDGDENWP